MLEASGNRSPDLHSAYIIGWCVELVIYTQQFTKFFQVILSKILRVRLQIQAATLIVDDILDESEMRRNQPCWHKMENIGRLAVNDALLIGHSAFYVLKKHARHLPRYTQIVELFHETSIVATIGQLLDAKAGTGGVSTFTMPLFKSICDGKTSHFAFYFPIALATLSHG